MNEQEIRDALAAALHDEVPCLISEKVGGELADALLPVVRRIVAAELREAATAWARGGGLAYDDDQAHEFLRDRADEMDPT